MNNQAQEALGYASLVLHDAERPLTADNIRVVMEAAGIDVLPIYASLFEKFFRSHDIESLMQIQTAGSNQSQAVEATATAADTSAPAKKEEEPEEDDDMGFGLFD
ncbi:60S acidic ribosomal protein P1 [Perkinsela sp. CCAP 1560/4]|nr:60S acidic ribosomal protein P1 [Perkinsela sp. CCAP 1560/4]|eukprot:KNH04446.1 60S acidic ribosomal protein P1 [Perkinsela sp. CCAP 1560/4]